MHSIHRHSVFLKKDVGVLATAKCFQTIKLFLENSYKFPSRNVSCWKLTRSDWKWCICDGYWRQPWPVPQNLTARRSPWSWCASDACWWLSGWPGRTATRARGGPCGTASESQLILIAWEIIVMLWWFIRDLEWVQSCAGPKDCVSLAVCH